MNFELISLCEGHIKQFKPNMQEAFQQGAVDWSVLPLQSLSVKQIVKAVCDFFVPCADIEAHAIGKAHVIQGNDMLCQHPQCIPLFSFAGFPCIEPPARQKRH